MYYLNQYYIYIVIRIIKTNAQLMYYLLNDINPCNRKFQYSQLETIGNKCIEYVKI